MTVEVEDRGVAPSSATASRSTRQGASLLAERFGLPVLLVIMVVVFSVLMPNTFATTANWRAIATSQSVLAVVALALMMPLISGRFDISVGANLGISSIVAASVMSELGAPLVVAIIAALVAGMIIGCINGLLVAFLGVNSIIATLGVAIILEGLIQAHTKGIPISTGLSETLTGLSTKLWLGVPVLFVLMLMIAVLVAVVVNHTTLGRYMVATGSNETAARLNGVSTRGIVWLSFVGAGLLAGIAGVLQLAAQGSGNPEVGGLGFILPALAAVFLGATTLRPGTYNVAGSVLGLFFVGIAVSGLAILGAEPWVTTVFNGTALVVAVTLSAVFRRYRTGAVAIGA